MKETHLPSSLDDLSWTPDMSGVDMSGVDMSGVDMSGVNMPAVDMQAVDTPAVDAPAVDTPAVDNNMTEYFKENNVFTDAKNKIVNENDYAKENDLDFVNKSVLHNIKSGVNLLKNNKTILKNMKHILIIYIVSCLIYLLGLLYFLFTIDFNSLYMNTLFKIIISSIVTLSITGHINNIYLPISFVTVIIVKLFVVKNKKNNRYENFYHY